MTYPALTDKYVKAGHFARLCLIHLNVIEMFNLSTDDVIHPESNKNSSTYQKIDRLLQHCDEAQLSVILATAEVIIVTWDKTQHD